LGDLLVEGEDIRSGGGFHALRWVLRRPNLTQSGWREGLKGR
jgi:hypothetical protein